MQWALSSTKSSRSLRSTPTLLRRKNNWSDSLKTFTTMFTATFISTPSVISIIFFFLILAILATNILWMWVKKLWFFIIVSSCIVPARFEVYWHWAVSEASWLFHLTFIFCFLKNIFFELFSYLQWLLQLFYVVNDQICFSYYRLRDLKQLGKFPRGKKREAIGVNGGI